MVSEVTTRWQRSARGNRPTSAAKTARSAQSRRGRGLVRAGWRPRAAARGARRPWWRTCGPSVGPTRAPAERSSIATAAARWDNVRPAITAGQRPRPDFWHPTGSPTSPHARTQHARQRHDMSDEPARTPPRDARPDPAITAASGSRHKQVEADASNARPCLTRTHASCRNLWDVKGIGSSALAQAEASLMLVSSSLHPIGRRLDPRALRKVVWWRGGHRLGRGGGVTGCLRVHGPVAACRGEERNGAPLGVSIVQDPHFPGSSVAPPVWHVRSVVLGRGHEW
jgi:hypothetical protein